MLLWWKLGLSASPWPWLWPQVLPQVCIARSFCYFLRSMNEHSHTAWELLLVLFPAWGFQVLLPFGLRSLKDHPRSQGSGVPTCDSFTEASWWLHVARLSLQGPLLCETPTHPQDIYTFLVFWLAIWFWLSCLAIKVVYDYGWLWFLKNGFCRNLWAARVLSVREKSSTQILLKKTLTSQDVTLTTASSLQTDYGNWLCSFCLSQVSC